MEDKDDGTESVLDDAAKAEWEYQIVRSALSSHNQSRVMDSNNGIVRKSVKGSVAGPQEKTKKDMVKEKGNDQPQQQPKQARGSNKGEENVTAAAAAAAVLSAAAVKEGCLGGSSSRDAATE